MGWPFMIASGSLVGSKWKISVHTCLKNGHCDFSVLKGHSNPLLTIAANISDVPNLCLNTRATTFVENHEKPG